MKVEVNVTKDGKSTAIAMELNLEVEYSFTPASLWLISVTRNAFKSKDLIYFKKVQQIISGTIRYENVFFEVQLAQYSTQEGLGFVVLSISRSDCSYTIEVLDPQATTELEDRIHLVDYEEIVRVPEFKGLTLLECVQKCLYDCDNQNYSDLFRLYYSKPDRKMYSQIEVSKIDL